MSDVLIAERNDGLMTLTFNRPQKKNAITSTIWNRLDAAIREAETDDDIRAVLITGADGNFSSGADLSGGDSPEEAKGGLTGRGRRLIVQDMRTIGEIISRLKRLPKPTIAAVDGNAVGVALGIALACDLIVATDRAKFSEVFVKRGLALDGGTSWTLPKLVGPRRAKQMAFFGEPLDASTALDWGLINDVVAPDDLLRVAGDWARRLAGGPTVALSLIKSMIDASESSSFDDAIEAEAMAQHITYTTADLQEGMQAFFERREPKFTGS